MQIGKNGYIGENVDGDKFYFDDDRAGPYGPPALVNENGEIYSDDVHTEYGNLLIYEIGRRTFFEEAMESGERTSLVDEGIDEGMRRFLNKDYLTDDQKQGIATVVFETDEE